MRSLNETDAGRVSVASRQLASRYWGFVDQQDVAQELWMWVLTHRRKVEDWEAEHHPKTVERLVMRSLRNAGEKYCRREKAAKSGYSVEDEFFYSIPLVADMLVLYFDPEWMAPAMNTTSETSTRKPPQEGGNLMAMVADVGKAYESMPVADQHLLHRIYGGDQPVRDAIAYEALMNDITPGAQDRRIRRVLGRMRAKLGGPAPFTDEEEE